jgi:hypothetical protein
MRTGDPVDLLNLLDAEGCDVDLSDGNVTIRPSPRWARLVDLSSWQLLAAVLLGAHTDHVWVRCDTCGAGLMRPKGAKPRRCVFTPRCEGMHTP